MKKIQTTTIIQGIVYESEFHYEINSEKLSETKTPLSGATFKVIKGKKYHGQEEVVSFRTDLNGNFSIEIPPGDYLIIEFDRASKFIMPPDSPEIKWDKKCLKNLWTKGLVQLSVEISEPVHVDITLENYRTSSHPCRQIKANK